LTAQWAVRSFTGLRFELLQGLVLSAVMGVAIVLRFVDLGAVGYNSDEAVYVGQAAAIAQVPVLRELFPIFRAHPLLFQFFLSLFYTLGAGDWLGRTLAAAVGVATIMLVYALGRRLYGPWGGVLAALFLAVMPYHVVASRQVMLDGPMALASTLTLFLMVRFGETEHPLWLYAAGAGMGLTVLTKETGILMVGAIYAFLALTPRIRVRVWDICLSLLTMVLIIAAYPLSILLAGGGSSGTTRQYLVWQLFRRPNHTWEFYLTSVAPAIGIPLILAALLGLFMYRRQNGWPEKLLVLWVLVPVIFFQLWPTKGFQYLLPAAPPLALLAAAPLVRWRSWTAATARVRLLRYLLAVILAGAIILPLGVASWNRIHPAGSGKVLAGSGGVPGGREMGEWISANVPQGATFMTIGPSMANIIRYYGHRPAFGLSVSPNPLHRNPSYQPVLNPDFHIRSGELQYLVWDSFSAERTTFFSEKLLYYTQKYGGRVIHTETVTLTDASGRKLEKPVIIIYEVRP